MIPLTEVLPSLSVGAYGRVFADLLNRYIYRDHDNPPSPRLKNPPQLGHGFPVVIHMFQHMGAKDRIEGAVSVTTHRGNVHLVIGVPHEQVRSPIPDGVLSSDVVRESLSWRNIQKTKILPFGLLHGQSGAQVQR